MAANEIHIADFGTIFTVTVKDGDSVIDLSGTTTKQLWFEDPDKETIEKDAIFVTDGTDGQIQYTIENGVFSKAGKWRLQVYYVNGAGEWHSDTVTFKVHANIG